MSRNTTGTTFMIGFYEIHSVFIFTLLYANFLYCFLMMCFYIDVKVDVWLWLESLLRKDELTFIHRQCCPNGWIDRRRLFTKKRPRHYQRLHLYSDILQAHFLFRIKNHQQIEASPQTFYWLKPLKKTVIISTRHFKSLSQLLQINNQSNLTRINILRPCSNFQSVKFYDKSS